MQAFILGAIIVLLLILVYYYHYHVKKVDVDVNVETIPASETESSSNGTTENYTTAGSRYPTNKPQTELDWMNTVKEMQLDPQVQQNHRAYVKDVQSRFYTGPVFNKLSGEHLTEQTDFQGFGGIRHKAVAPLISIGESARQVPTIEEADMLPSRNNFLQWSPTAANSEYFGNRRTPDRGEDVATDFARAERGYAYLHNDISY